MALRSKRTFISVFLVVLASILLTGLAANGGQNTNPNAITHSTAPPSIKNEGPLSTSSTTSAPPRTPPSGEAMPTGDLPGWKRLFADDFNTDAKLGTFTKGPYANDWDVYVDGTRDTAGQSEEDADSGYYPSKVISVKDGVLNKSVHSEDGVAMGAAIIPKRSYDQTYGRYSVRFRAESVEGFKIAYMLWPDSDEWPDDGEIDFPEGNLDTQFYAAAHYAQPWTGESARDKFDSNLLMNEWHTATTEWTPGQVSFFIDGKLLGTSTKKVPSKPMHWVLQTETCIGECQPSEQARGNVEIDWVAIWERA